MIYLFFTKWRKHRGQRGRERKENISIVCLVYDRLKRLILVQQGKNPPEIHFYLHKFVISVQVKETYEAFEEVFFGGTIPTGDAKGQ